MTTKPHKKNGIGISYTAEIKYHGKRYRKSSTSYDVCKHWLDEIRKIFNSNRNDIDGEVCVLNRTYKGQLRKRTYKSFNGINELNKKYGVITYVLFNPYSNQYKIGKSKNLCGRISAFCMPELQLILYKPGDSEVEVHKLLCHQREAGEWFTLDESNISLLESKGFIRFV